MKLHTNDRGVSDVVAFTLSVGIILMAATTAYVMGVDELNDVQEFEQEQRVVRAMEGAGDTYAEVYRGDTPGQSAEFDVSDGTLSVEQSSIAVRVEDSGGTALASRAYDTNALSLSSGDTTASFESGLVAQRVGDAALPRRAPSFVCGDTATLTLVELRGVSSHGGGSVVVDATLNRSASALDVSETTADEVVVDVSGSVNQRAWERTLEANTEWTARGNGEYACDAQTVHVRRVVLDLYVES